MSSLPVIDVQGLGKSYNLGEIGVTTLRESFSRFCEGFFVRKKAEAPVRSGERQEGRVFHALRDVSFQVPPGQALGLIGPNGAGKSTLLKILSRITRPTRGTITLRGRCASLLEVGTGFHPDLTGRENVFMNGALLGMSIGEVKAKFDEIVAFSGVERFIDTPVKRYSSGMYVRLAFAVAAHLEPEILVVDEVLAVGDAAFQSKCLGKMQEVGKQGRTVLFVSHNLAAVKELTDRCLVLTEGKIIFDGEPEAAADFYLQEARNVTAWEADLDALERRDYMGPDTGLHWRFTGLRMGHGADGLYFGDTIKVELDYHSIRAQEDITLTLHVADNYGTKIITCRSIDAGVKLRCAAGEKGSVRLEIPNPGLPPGVYLLKVNAVSGLEVYLDLLPEAMRFEVISSSETDYWTQASRQDGIRLPSRWERLG